MVSRHLGAAALSGLLALGLAGAGAAGDAEVAAARSAQSGTATVAAVSAHAALGSEAVTLAPARSAERGRAGAPFGWKDFCRRYASECVRERTSGEIVFDGAMRNLIESVNAHVNAAIAPRTDLAQWGIEERWDFAETGIGDCEDVVLLKQRWLVSAGLPRAALLVTVVTDLAGDGHAVLTVVTDRGDYILDNMHDDVKLWRETPYGFVKRQSRAWTDEWVSLNGRGAEPAMASR